MNYNEIFSYNDEVNEFPLDFSILDFYIKNYKDIQNYNFKDEWKVKIYYGIYLEAFGEADSVNYDIEELIKYTGFLIFGKYERERRITNYGQVISKLKLLLKNVVFNNKELADTFIDYRHLKIFAGDYWCDLRTLNKTMSDEKIDEFSKIFTRENLYNPKKYLKAVYDILDDDESDKLIKQFIERDLEEYDSLFDDD